MTQAAEVQRPFFTVQVHDVGVGFPDVLAGEVQEHAFAGFRVFQDDAPGVRNIGTGYWGRLPSCSCWTWPSPSS